VHTKKLREYFKKPLRSATDEEDFGKEIFWK
jgi:hypothetical protein